MREYEPLGSVVLWLVGIAMDNEGRHLNDAEKTEGPEQQEGKTDTSVLSRRRALLAGLSAAPAVLTLLSRSAFAQRTDLSCATVNSIVAGTSLHRDVTPTNADINACKNQ